MAVVSQPFDRGCKVQAPGSPDDSLGEFWEDDPWQIMMRHNQSAFERNRTFLNVEGKQFLDISYITGADTDGDSRAVVAADFRNDGRLDLMVRQVGGQPFLYYENGFPTAGYLKISLRGRKSNRLGIGARITIQYGDKMQFRELLPPNSFNSQGPVFAHFGLGHVDEIDSLTVEWPSGAKQTHEKIKTNQHIYITEDRPKETVVAIPGEFVAP